MMVHANAHPDTNDPEYWLTFRSALSPIEVGRMEKGGARYGNTDLPDLRGATARDLVALLIDGCQRMGGLGVDAPSTPTKVEILDGQVYRQYPSEPDRKARVYVVGYLNTD